MVKQTGLETVNKLVDTTCDEGCAMKMFYL